MVDNPLTRRRRFLQGAGLTGAAIIAGCSAPDSDDDATTDNGANGDEDENGEDEDNGTQNGEENGDEDPPADARTVGVVPNASEEQQQELQSLQLQLRQGEIDEDEAQEQQRAIIQEIIDDFVTNVQETDVFILEEYVDIGMLKIAGDADVLIDILEMDASMQMVSEADLDEQAALIEG